MIHDYFTLLVSLEYNMQELQKVQKLMNDMVDITITVILNIFLDCTAKTNSVWLHKKHRVSHVLTWGSFPLTFAFPRLLFHLQ